MYVWRGLRPTVAWLWLLSCIKVTFWIVKLSDLFFFFKHQEVVSLRLSSRQISLLLSSIWAQSISPVNMPENYEAIAHTYSLVLLFSRGKVFINLCLAWYLCSFIHEHVLLVDWFRKVIFGYESFNYIHSPYSVSSSNLGLGYVTDMSSWTCIVWDIYLT